MTQLILFYFSQYFTQFTKGQLKTKLDASLWMLNEVRLKNNKQNKKFNIKKKQ